MQAPRSLRKGAHAGNPGFSSGSTDVLTNVSDTQTITRFGWFALLPPPQTEAPPNHWTVSDGVFGRRLFPTTYASVLHI